MLACVDEKPPAEQSPSCVPELHSFLGCQISQGQTAELRSQQIQRLGLSPTNPRPKPGGRNAGLSCKKCRGGGWRGLSSSWSPIVAIPAVVSIVIVVVVVVVVAKVRRNVYSSRGCRSGSGGGGGGGGLVVVVVVAAAAGVVVVVAATVGSKSSCSWSCSSSSSKSRN